MQAALGEDRSATFSEDRVYRYALRRIWDPSLPPVLFIGLNPSTADETEDDPTIRRCIRFARDWGYGGLLMGNLFAFRATDPSELAKWSETRVSPVGERITDGHYYSVVRGSVNNEQLKGLARMAGLVIAAWGAKVTTVPGFEDRGAQVQQFIGGHMHCLGLTKDGHPKHPLYLKADTRPTPLPDHEHQWGEWVMYEGSQERRSCATCGAEQVD